MCEMAEKEVRAILEDTPNNAVKSAIIVFAQKFDSNFNKLEKKMDKILDTVETNTREQRKYCAAQKLEISNKFAEVDKTNEDLNYFKRNPKLMAVILDVVKFAAVILVGLAIGRGV